MTQRNFYRALVILLSLVSLITLDAKSDRDSQLINLQKIEEVLPDNLSYSIEEDDDLDLFDESSMKDLLESIDQTKGADTGTSVQQKAKLALTYLKIKALNAKEIAETHLALNRSNYAAAAAVTLAMITLFCVVYKFTATENKKTASKKKK